jgi:ATP-dependent DNA ligase
LSADLLHEIKHDGFRVIARKDGSRVRLYSRPGNELTDRFRLIVEALVWLRASSCIIDGEAVCCDDDGMPSFDRIRYRRHDESVFLYAFDLIELNGDDLRREPLDTRKAVPFVPRCARARRCGHQRRAVFLLPFLAAQLRRYFDHVAMRADFELL